MNIMGGKKGGDVVDGCVFILCGVRRRSTALAIYGHAVTCGLTTADAGRICVQSMSARMTPAIEENSMKRKCQALKDNQRQWQGS